MDKRKLPQTEEYKNKIGLSNKGKHLGTSNGNVILKNGKKLCPVCKEWKVLSEYDKRPERPIGVKPKCKVCTKAYRDSKPQQVKYTQYKSGAKKRGLDFDLSKEDFQTLWQKSCFYCAGEIATIGLDRIDSNLGYKLDNVVPCCAICNTMKLALTRDIFIEHCYKIIKNQIPD